MPSLVKNKSTGYFYAQFYNSKRRPRTKKVSLGTTVKRDAKVAFRNRVSDYVRGTFDPWEPKQREDIDTLGDAVDAYFRLSNGLDKKTIENRTHLLKRLEKSIGRNTLITDVRTIDLLNVIMKREIKNSTYMRYRGEFNIFFSFCKDTDLIEKNPASKLPKRKAAKKLPKYLTKKEVETLCEKIEAHGVWSYMIPIIRATIYTLFRESEVAACKKKWFDFERNTITLYFEEDYFTKNRKEETIILPKAARSILYNRTKHLKAEDYVFTDNDGKKLTPKKICMTFTYCRKMAKLSDRFTFHSLRESGCSWLGHSNTNIFAIQRQARHESIKTTQIYVHIPDDIYRDSINKGFS